VGCKYCSIDYDVQPGEWLADDIHHRKAICEKKGQEIVGLVRERFIYKRLYEIGIPQWCPLL
jgi:hypothetical protein